MTTISFTHLFARGMTLGVILAALFLTWSPVSTRAQTPSTDDRRAMAEEAFIYGLPMVMNYEIFYAYFLDKSSSQYKAPINQLHNIARVFTPKDTAIVTPNSDTPYSFIAMDLRAEPYVICNPAIEKSRYFSVHLIDMYTFAMGYIGSRTTGNGAACHMIVGPGWKGEKPQEIGNVYRSETEFAIAGFRTQLFNPADIDNVKRVQTGYRGQTLSQFQNKPAPPAEPAINWPRIDRQLAESDFFRYLSFVLQYAPATGPAAVETPLRARFARIGIEAGERFSMDNLTPQEKEDVNAGMASGTEKIKQRLAAFGTNRNGWLVGTEGFGNRQAYAGDWTLRAAAAMGGIYGLEAVEALYPLLAKDSEGNAPDTSKNRYTLTFSGRQLPPANSFWSVTMYDGKTQLLIENPINRYLINSGMLPDPKKEADGSLTLYIQRDSPGADKEANWLPAPDGPAYVVMRLYWPQPAALDGSWMPPPVVRQRESTGGRALK